MTNPYRPGAGFMPPYLAGRKEETQLANNLFFALNNGIPCQSVLYSGLRGVGKTALLVYLEEQATNENIHIIHIEIDNNSDFISLITSECQRYLIENKNSEKIKNLLTQALDLIKSLVISFGNVTVKFKDENMDLYISQNLSQTLSELFVKMGLIAKTLNKPICLFVDEVQYIKVEELSALIYSLHRVNQLGYPIASIVAGIPKVFKLLTDVKTYAERLFICRDMGSIDYESTKMALDEPLKAIGVTIDEDAVKKIYDITEGYPFFIQQLAKVIFDNLKDKHITLDCVKKSIVEFQKILDSGFYKIRYDKCSDYEKKFIKEMALIGNLPVDIADIAERIGKTVKSISPIRAKLIDKGIIYIVDDGKLDFTAPKFSDFLLRN